MLLVSSNLITCAGFYYSEPNLGTNILHSTDLEKEKATEEYIKTHPGARKVANYILVHRGTNINYYKVNGAEMPCNPYNNGSVLITTTTTYKKRKKRFVEINNNPSEYLLPDCDSLTTNIVWAYSVTVAEAVPTAAADCLKPTLILLHVLCIYILWDNQLTNSDRSLRVVSS